MVDALVLGLFNRRQFTPEDFYEPESDASDLAEPPPDDPQDTQRCAQSPQRAIHLGPVGREVLMAAWYKRLYGPVRYGPGGARHRIQEIFYLQARQLARVCLGDAPSYAPYSWT